MLPLLVITLSIVYLGWKWVYRGRYGFVTEKYVSLRTAVAKSGRIPSSATPGDIVRESARLPAGEAIKEFVAIYERHRFGCKIMGPDDRKRYSKLLRTIKKKLKNRPFLTPPGRR
jgi:hypothetical protein